ISAKLDFNDFTPGDEIECDNNVMLKTILLDHPGLAVGYALYIGNKKICYITDTETQNIDFKQNICNFVKDADICIYDSTFTDDEKPQHVGWKHSSWQDAVSVAKISNVKKLVLFHHSPTRSSEELDIIEKEAKSLYTHVIMAKENMIFTL
ncbi:MBL fold metallo-hydrolase, partial [Rickettsiaceae bacterium]|nr:MBL fold metallo-hydrolase [Rickettsiaceae bacterium]